MAGRNPFGKNPQRPDRYPLTKWMLERSVGLETSLKMRLFNGRLNCLKYIFALEDASEWEEQVETEELRELRASALYWATRKGGSAEGLARVYAHTGDSFDLRAAQRFSRGLDDDLEIVRVLVSRGDTEIASNMAGNMPVKSVHRARALMAMYDSDKHQLDHARVIRAIDEVENPLDAVKLFCEHALRHTHSGNWEIALNAVEKFDVPTEWRGAAWLEYAVALARFGQHDEARHIIEARLDLYLKVEGFYRLYLVTRIFEDLNSARRISESLKFQRGVFPTDVQAKYEPLVAVMGAEKIAREENIDKALDCAIAIPPILYAIRACCNIAKSEKSDSALHAAFELLKRMMFQKNTNLAEAQFEYLCSCLVVPPDGLDSIKFARGIKKAKWRFKALLALYEHKRELERAKSAPQG